MKASGEIGRFAQGQILAPLSASDFADDHEALDARPVLRREGTLAEKTANP